MPPIEVTIASIREVWSRDVDTMYIFFFLLLLFSFLAFCRLLLCSSSSSDVVVVVVVVAFRRRCFSLVSSSSSTKSRRSCSSSGSSSEAEEDKHTKEEEKESKGESLSIGHPCANLIARLNLFFSQSNTYVRYFTCRFLKEFSPHGITPFLKRTLHLQLAHLHTYTYRERVKTNAPPKTF